MKVIQKHVVPDEGSLQKRRRTWNEGSYRNDVVPGMKVTTETRVSGLTLLQKRRRTWMKVIQKHVVPDEGNLHQAHVVPDEGYYRKASYLMKVITETRRSDEGYYRNTSYLMKVITEKRRTDEGYGQKLRQVPHFWLLQKHVVPDEGYYTKHVVPDEGYYRKPSYLIKVITETRRT